MPIVKRYTFYTGAILSTSQLNTNFDDIVNSFNAHTHTQQGNDANLITSSGIAPRSVQSVALQFGMVRQRQGADPNSWSANGTTNYDTSTGNVFVQVGSDVGTGVADRVTTFPVAFINNPIVLVSTAAASVKNVWTEIVATTNTTFTTRQLASDNSTGSEVFNWIAIGI